MKIVVYISSLAICLGLHAQKNVTARPLKIGDKLPDNVVSYLIAHNPAHKFKDHLKNKLIILDFWATYCAPCIEALPLLNELQTKFSKNLQIFIVNSQSRSGVAKTFGQRPLTKRTIDSLALPAIYSDKLLNACFPHQIKPHEVWINKKGIVCAITEARYVSVSNIEKIISGAINELPEKMENLSYDYEKPLLPQIYRAEGNFLKYYSAVFNFVPGLWGATMRYAIDSTKHTIRLSRCSYTLLELYGDALSHFSSGDPFRSPEFDYGNRVILQVADSGRFFYPGDRTMTYEEWENQNKFSYESVNPLDKIDSVYAYMINELNQYFNLFGRIEKRKMRCLALIKMNNTSLHPQPSSQKPESYFGIDSVYRLVNLPLKTFRNVLSERNRNHIFIDETGFKENVNLEIKSSLHNILTLRQELNQKYGLDLVETEKEINMMVISDAISSHL